jgi:hypothetical protein
VNATRDAGLRAIFGFLRLFNAVAHRARQRGHRATAGKTKLPRHQLGGQINGEDGQNSNACIYIVAGHKSIRRIRREQWHSSRITVETGAERQRAARARTEEKQRRKEEKAALRNAKREAAEAPPDEKRRCGRQLVGDFWW